MKRYFTVGLITIMTFLIVMPVSAQIFGVGVKGGLNISTLRGDFETEISTKTGFVIGVAFNTSLVPFVSLQPEILYSEKGAKLGVVDFRDVSMDLTYLDVPVLLRVGLPVPGFSPFVYAGPSISYILSAKESHDGEISHDIKELINNLDIGFAIGGGLEFGLLLLKLHAELRYTIGFSNIFDNYNGGDTDLTNGVVSLMVGVTF